MINLNDIKQNVKADKLNMLLDCDNNLSVTSLLSSNYKLAKYGLNGINIGLTLSPFKTLNNFDNGPAVNYCQNGKDCFKTCLFNQAGRFGMKKGREYSVTQLAGIKRSLLFNNNLTKFTRILIAEVGLLLAQLEDKQQLFIRLNTMSDIDFSGLKTSIINVYGDQVVFYDYTKRIELLDTNKNMAYSVMKTTVLKRSHLRSVIKNNAKLAIIVSNDTKEKLLLNYPAFCFSGDDDDLFFIRPGYISLLSPNGLTTKSKKALDHKMTLSEDQVINIIRSLSFAASLIDMEIRS